MAVEYNAIALALAAIMFFLMEFATRFNLNTGDDAYITINEWGKIFFMVCSLLTGLGLILFAYNAADNNTEFVKTMLLNMVYIWGLLIFVVVCLFGAYIIYFLPKMINQSEGKNRRNGGD